MSQHHFETFIAEKYGIEIAVLIDNFVFWTRTNAAANKNYHEGRYWSYGTPQFFKNYFTYFTERKIKTLLQKCVKNNILITGNFNKKGYDRTNWYALSDQILSELNLDKTCRKPASELIGQKTAMDRTKYGDASDKNRRPIPDTKPDTKPDTNTPLSPKGESVREQDFSFKEFWEIYPVKKGRKKCEQIWKRKNLSKRNIEILAKLKEQIERDDQWLRGYIPHPSTYLTQERWDDEITLGEKERIEKEKTQRQADTEKKQREQIRLSELRRQEELRKLDEVKHSKKRFTAIKKAVKQPLSESSRQGLNDLMRSLTGRGKKPDAT